MKHIISNRLVALFLQMLKLFLALININFLLRNTYNNVLNVITQYTLMLLQTNRV